MSVDGLGADTEAFSCRLDADQPFLESNMFSVHTFFLIAFVERVLHGESGKEALGVHQALRATSVTISVTHRQCNVSLLISREVAMTGTADRFTGAIGSAASNFQAARHRGFSHKEAK